MCVVAEQINSTGSYILSVLSRLTTQVGYNMSVLNRYTPRLDYIYDGTGTTRGVMVSFPSL